MTNEEAIQIIESECYIADLLNLDRTQMVNTALNIAIESMKELEKLKQFIHFVAKSVMEDDFETNGSFYAEVFCRKLNKLGVIREDGENWVYDEGDEADEYR